MLLHSDLEDGDVPNAASETDGTFGSFGAKACLLVTTISVAVGALGCVALQKKPSGAKSVRKFISGKLLDQARYFWMGAIMQWAACERCNSKSAAVRRTFFVRKSELRG